MKCFRIYVTVYDSTSLEDMERILMKDSGVCDVGLVEDITEEE